VTLLLALLLATLRVAAQDEPEYRLEIGGSAGLATYEGDFNGSLLSNMQPMGGLVAKYKLNPRMAWGAELSYAKLKGGSKNVETWYPELADNPVTFGSQIVSFDVKFEYNFWPFGTGREYRGARKLTPFIAAGLGFGIIGGDGSGGAFQMAFGLGVKYKLAPRLNLTGQWVMHFTGSDQLDGVKDPYGIVSSGLFKNTDCFSALQVALTYDLWAKCKTCHNDRD